MSSYLPKNTLAYHLARPLLMQRSIEAAPCVEVAKLILKFKKDYPADQLPETEAIEFYQLAHAMALIQGRRHPHEPLPTDELSLVDEYFTRGSQIAQRALYYLILICSREARWLSNKSTMKATIASKWDKATANFICSLDDEAETAMMQFATAPPEAPLGNYMRALSYLFHKGSWKSSSYGGEKWGVVTDAATNLVIGKYSPLMMIDTVWTLAHNNGPIFNKGMLYKHHSGNALIQILDAQAAGMIPALIICGGTPLGTIHQFLTTKIVAQNNKIKELFPDIPVTVDWSKVEELGAKLKYTGYAKKKTPSVIDFESLYEPVVPQFQLYPGFSLPIATIDRKEAA